MEVPIRVTAKALALTIRTAIRENGTQSYGIDGNRLTSIGGLRNGSFGYDANGNQTYDGTRGVNLSYNYLNLPQSVSGNRTISYTYDATGRKLRKVSNISGTTDYVNGIHYKNISGTYQIEFIQTEEGRALKQGSNNSGTASYSYEFTLGDHLGNNRVTFYRNPTTQNVEQLESTDYYPFGMATVDPGAKQNKYLYNKKENQEELEELDYGARFYDPVIGRWTGIDPKAEKYLPISPYVYCADNPMKYIDPNGKEIWISYYNKEKDKTESYQYKNGKLYNENGKLYKGGNSYVKTVASQLDQLKKDNKTVAGLIGKLEKNDYHNTITNFSPGQEKGMESKNQTRPDNSMSNFFTNFFKAGDNAITQFNPFSKVDEKTPGATRNPRVGLAHELKHQLDVNDGTYKAKNGWFVPSPLAPGGKLLQSESEANHIENLIRAVTNDSPVPE